MTNRLIENRYECLRKIGEGGMAIVYEAKDRKLNRMVAVKILHEHLQHREDLRERFIQEARSVSKLKHSNILEIYDFSGEKSQELWVVTELLSGIDLSKFIREFDHKKIDPILASCIVREIALALEEAHSHGIIHRDIKPSNIMFTKQGRVKLMDFGIAKDASAGHLTQTGTFMGSPSYMSPEQIRGSGVSFSSDVYSLCVLFYELVTGRVPFRGSNTAEIITKIIEDDPIPPKDIHERLSPSINEFILKGLEKKPEYRFERTDTLARELAQILKEHGLGDSRVELEVYSKNTQNFFDKLTFPPPAKQTLEIKPNHVKGNALPHTPQEPDSKSDQSKLSEQNNRKESKLAGLASSENQAKDRKDSGKNDQNKNDQNKNDQNKNDQNKNDQNKKDLSVKSDPNLEDGSAKTPVSTNQTSPSPILSGGFNADLRQKLATRSDESNAPKHSMSRLPKGSRFSLPWVITIILIVLSVLYLVKVDSSLRYSFSRVFDRIKYEISNDSESKSKSVKTPRVEDPSEILSDETGVQSKNWLAKDNRRQSTNPESKSDQAKNSREDKKSKPPLSYENIDRTNHLGTDGGDTPAFNRKELGYLSPNEQNNTSKNDPKNPHKVNQEKSENRKLQSGQNANKTQSENDMQGFKKNSEQKSRNFDRPSFGSTPKNLPNSNTTAKANTSNTNQNQSIFEGDIAKRTESAATTRMTDKRETLTDKTENIIKAPRFNDDRSEASSGKILGQKRNSSPLKSGSKLASRPKVGNEVGVKLGQLFVSANLSATLHINGKNYGNLDSSGKTYELAAGAYEIRLSKPGYKTAKGFARIENGKITRLIDLTIESEKNYKLIMMSDNSFPVDITISSADLTQKHTVSKGTKVITLPAGTYSIKALAGDKSLQRRISLPSPYDADGSVTFTLELDP